MQSEINLPDIVAEVQHAFEHYNAALNTNNVTSLNQFFWESLHTVRFGPGENLYGYAEIAQFRGTKWVSGPIRRLARVVITTIGRDFATTSAVFARGDDDVVVRQSQTWVRFPEGWRIVAAHVSPLKAR